MAKRFFLKILSLKILSCLFAVLVFARFTQLADAERYINADIVLSLSVLLDRTYFTDNFYASLALITGKGIAIHLATAVLVTFSIWYVFKDYSEYLPKIFWIILVLPFFAIWTSVVGKEALSIVAFLFLIKWIADVVLLGKSNALLLIVGIIVGGIVRPNYAIPYFFIVLMIYFFLHGKKQISLSSGKRFSVGSHIFMILIGFFLFALMFGATTQRWEPALEEVMQVSESYFLSYDGGSNRQGIKWGEPSDFFNNMYWGIPVSIIGPTPIEVLQKPIFIPFFIEGVITALLLPYYFYKLFKLSFKNYRIRFFFYVAFIPAVLLALLIHYPLGIFNPGSAMRYKQSLIPLFYFLPILIISMSKSITGKSKN